MDKHDAEDMLEFTQSVSLIQDIVTDGNLDDAKFVRRSERNPEINQINRPDIHKLLSKIKSNDESTVVLKLKDFIQSDISCAVLDAIIKALSTNTVCQALYVQNISKAMTDKQLKSLVNVFKNSMIWCLNIGENYEVTLNGWVEFCDELLNTNITHLYVSEHVIPLELKNKMRDNIRINRKKHTLHCDENNIDVIERCTHMWWNPINSIKHREQQKVLLEQKKIDEEKEKERKAQLRIERKRLLKEQKQLMMSAEKKRRKKRKAKELDIIADDTWGDFWIFECSCGLSCTSSSWKKTRIPLGDDQFECTSCKKWSHAKCVLGPRKTIDDLNLLREEDQLCKSCKTKKSRGDRYKTSWLQSPSVNSVSSVVTGYTDTSKDSVASIDVIKEDPEDDNENSDLSSIATGRDVAVSDQVVDQCFSDGEDNYHMESAGVIADEYNVESIDPDLNVFP